MEVQGAKSLPKRCIYPQCRRRLKREYVIGVVPFSPTTVGVLYHCNWCGKIYSFMMPAMLVSQFSESLPRAAEVLDKKGGRKMEGRGIITTREITSVINEFRTDGVGLIEKLKRAEEEDSQNPSEEK